MAQKSQYAGSSDGQSNPASSSAREGSEAATSHKHSGAHSSASYSVLPKMSDPTPTFGQNSALSQPMAKSNSSGSNPPHSSKDAAAGGTASPYGTRSRNRHGASRPNYAEDKDIDMELFEMYPERREDEAKKASRLSLPPLTGPLSQDTPPPPRSTTTTGSSRKPLPSENTTKHASSQQHPKEPHAHHHQHSTPAPAPANPTTNGTQVQTSKKRRAAAQSSNAASAAQNPSGSSTHGTGRRNGAVTHSNANSGVATGLASDSRGYAETNMLTFENCKARPRDGKMIADDGSVLSVNGKLHQNSTS